MWPPGNQVSGVIADTKYVDTPTPIRFQPISTNTAASQPLSQKSRRESR